MMPTALVGAEIFDGERRRSGAAVLLDGALVAGVVAEDEIPADATRIALGGGLLAPGFIDAQVNGGGGVMLNGAGGLAGRGG